MTPKGTHAPAAPTRAPALRHTARAPLPEEEQNEAQAELQEATSVRRTWAAPKPSDPPLIRLLLKEANRRGHQMREMAEALGCTYGYIAQLRTGFRKPEHIGQEFAHKASRYLGVPTALVKLSAGRVTFHDFVWPQRDPMQDIADCLEEMRDDPVVGAYFPEELLEASPVVKQFVWQLYTECSDMHPTRSRMLPRMMEYLQRAAMVEDEFEAEVAEMREAVSQPKADVRKRG